MQTIFKESLIYRNERVENPTDATTDHELDGADKLVALPAKLEASSYMQALWDEGTKVLVIDCYRHLVVNDLVKESECKEQRLLETVKTFTEATRRAVKSPMIGRWSVRFGAAVWTC